MIWRLNVTYPWNNCWEISAAIPKWGLVSSHCCWWEQEQIVLENPGNPPCGLGPDRSFASSGLLVAVPASVWLHTSHQRIPGTHLGVWWRAALHLCIRINYNWERNLRKKWFLALFSAVPSSWSSDSGLCFLLPTDERHPSADGK